MDAMTETNPLTSFKAFEYPNPQAIVIGHEASCVGVLPSSNKNITSRSRNDSGNSLFNPATKPPWQKTQSALAVVEGRKYQIIHDFPAPQDLGPHEVLIRTHAVGLNHIDWKSVDYNYCLPAFPWVTGREMAGVVARIGSAVDSVHVGERVWTSTYYKDRRAGCFQELVVVPQHTVFRIPSRLDFNTAATLGVPAATAAMTLWRWLDIPCPSESSTTSGPLDTTSPPKSQDGVLLIWGASTVTGQFCLQFAAQAGVEIIAVCSESTAPLVESLGARHVVTYTGKGDFHLIGEILTIAQGRLRKAIDIVGAKTAALVLDIIQACGRQQAVDFAPLGFMAKGQVIPSNAHVLDVQMKQFILDESARVYGERVNALLESGSVRPPRLRVLPGGLDAIESGLEMVKTGSLAGEKLIVSFT